MTREEFGQKLKELRNRSKLTQTEVADFLGFETNGKGRISDWERGKGQPDADTFLVLCDLYKVDDVLAEFKPELRTFPTWDNLNPDESEILTLYRQAEPTIKEAVGSVLKSCVPIIANGRKASQEMEAEYERTHCPHESGSA